jgi:outer membrane protein insertion porin family
MSRYKRPLVSLVEGVLFLFLSHLFSPMAPLLQAQAEVVLKEIRIQGNLRIEEDGIRLHIKARQGELYDPTTTAEDVKSIYRMGFFDDVRAELSPEGFLTYVVKESPYVREVRIQGNEQVKQELIETALGVRPRTIFDRDKVSKGVERVKKLYTEQGYVNARVDFAVSEVENNQAIVLLDIVEGKRVLVKKISFEGNRAFSDKKLRGLMGTKKKWFLSSLTGRGVLDQDVLTNDLAVISSHYYDNGYITHKIDEPVILRRKDGIQIVVRIEEGDQFKVGKVEIGGDLIEKPESLLERVQMTSGQIFRGSRLREDIKVLSERYADHGFAFAQVDPVTELEPQEKKVDVAFVINRGPPVHFNRISIAGNTKTRDKVIRRELAMAEQDLFSSRKIVQSRNALQRTGYFKDVQLKTKKTAGPGSVDLLVDVKEGPTGNFNVGAGFSTGNRFTFNAGVSERNLFGQGQSLSAAFDIGAVQQNFLVSYTEPYLLESRLSLGVDAFNNRLEFTDFNSRRTGFGIRTGYPLKYVKFPFVKRSANHSDYEYPAVSHDQPASLLDHMRGGMAYQLERNKISGVDSEAPRSIQEEEGTSWTSSVTPSLSYDSRDHFFNPTEGARSRAALKVAGLGGDNRFIKSDTTATWYRTLLRSPNWGGTYTLMLRGTLGYGVGFAHANGTDDIPVSERYFPGGMNSVRGFEERSLGPNDDGDPVGGDKQVILNTELHFPLLENYGIRGIAFFDQGQAFGKSESIDPGKFRRSVGTGVRWLSPFGPLRVEFGFALNDEPEDETAVVGFSVGGQALR